VSGMATWDDVRLLALLLPEVMERSSQGSLPSWRVRDKSFAWERPLRATDLQMLGDTAPQGPMLAARVPDLGAKQALLADEPDVYFTIPHFDGYPAILVRLARIALPELEELLVAAWHCRAQAPRRRTRSRSGDQAVEAPEVGLDRKHLDLAEASLDRVSA